MSDLCAYMTITAIARNHTKDDLDSFFAGADMHWNLLTEVPAPHEYPQTDLYLDLDFDNAVDRKEALSRLLPGLVFVNAVTPTLGEIGYPFVRINGWPGFRMRNIYE